MPISRAKRTQPHYIAEVRGSREVTLFGVADVRFWEEKLAGESITLAREAGQARVMITAVASRWMGISFSELIIGLQTAADPQGAFPAGLFLLTGYNTSRIFTWFERNYFHTPYRVGNVHVPSEQPRGFELQLRKQAVIVAECRAREPATTEEINWEGPVFLPRVLSPQHPQGCYYQVRLSGTTEIFPFRTAADAVHIKSSDDEPILSWLSESGFQGDEWHVRSKALHARSKTYQREF